MTVLDALPLSPPLRRRLTEWVALTRFDRPIGWLLLLWPILWALWIAARGVPSAKLLGHVAVRAEAKTVVSGIADGLHRQGRRCYRKNFWLTELASKT